MYALLHVSGSIGFGILAPYAAFVTRPHSKRGKCTLLRESCFQITANCVHHELRNLGLEQAIKVFKSGKFKKKRQLLRPFPASGLAIITKEDL